VEVDRPQRHPDEDPALFKIRRHIAATIAYDRAVDEECSAEGKVSREEYARQEARPPARPMPT
jgi:hypothetical protein